MANDSQDKKAAGPKRPPPIRADLDLAVIIRSGDSARRKKERKRKVVRHPSSGYYLLRQRIKKTKQSV